MIKENNNTNTITADNLYISYPVSPENIERDKRQSKRAEELGIDLYVLDGDDDSELQHLEDDIVYNYILMDKDVPEELKTKYLKLKAELITKPPILDKPLQHPYSVTPDDMDRFRREVERARELGIDMYILDGEPESPELEELENEIVYNYILMDLDVPEELKAKYLKLKEEVNTDKTLA